MEDGYSHTHTHTHTNVGASSINMGTLEDGFYTVQTVYFMLELVGNQTMSPQGFYFYYTCGDIWSP